MSILTYFRCNFNYPTVRTERDPTYSTFSGLVSRFENGRVSSLANDIAVRKKIELLVPFELYFPEGSRLL
jgi:hypothetical protein